MMSARISMRRIAIIGALALAVGAAAGIFVHQHTRSTLMSEAFTRLALYHDLRKAALEDYMRSKSSDVIAMSRNARVLDALGKFENAWSEIPSDAATVLRRLYIKDSPFPEGRKRDLRSASDESEYTKVHAPFHDWARRFLEHFGYYDLFLIDRSGNILYTVEKEDDFATNLMDGPYADSPLGSVFQRALKSTAERAIISDYERYTPSNGAPALFAGSAIRTKDGSVTGVFVVQLAADPINTILRFTEGMGTTGETYVVGNDETMRSQSRFSTESTLLTTKVATASVSQGMAGFRGNHVIPDYRGVPVLSVFSPVDFGGPPWVLLAEIDEAEVLARQKIWQAIAAALFAAGVSVFLGYLALGALRHD